MSSRGNFYSSVAENHQFVTNDPILLHYGAGSFTLKSIKDVLKAIRSDGENISDEEFYTRYISGKEDDDLKADILFASANTNQWSGSEFSPTSNSSSTITKSFEEVKSLITTFEEKIEDLVLVVPKEEKDGQRDKAKSAKEWIDQNINVFKNGKDSYLELSGTIFYDADQDGDSNKEYYTRLYFSMPGERKNERVIAQKGKMVMSSVGTRATGSKYSFGKSHRITSGSTAANGATRHAGLFVPPNSNDGSSVDDLASGPIRLSYNDGLGMWESSQTILARLLTNVPSAVNKPFQIPEEDGEVLKNEEDAALFYDKGSKYYTGNFTTGLAVPVSCQNRNPHLFGPNIILDEYGDKRVEKIRVVNRTEKEFSGGTIVLCTLIGAEWVVHEFGKSGAGIPTQLGPWTFSKFIANSDHYFRDKDGTDPLWDINRYEEKARAKWYNDWVTAVADGSESHLSFHNITAISTDNGAESVSFNPSCGYQTCTSFDSADFFASGVINIDQAIDNSEGFPVGDDIPLFWGPVLPDGYNSRAPSVGEAGAKFGVNKDLYFHSTKFKDTMNIPADMAVNGPYSDDYNTSPILPIDYWQEKISNGGSLYDNALAYRSEIYNSPTYINGFGYQPKNPNRIQFSPLTFEMVINTDEDRGGDTDKDDIYNYMREEYGSDMFGKMFDRYSCVTKQGKQIQYDKKITRRPLSMPYGTWFTLFEQENEPYEGLNLFAVTAGINRFSRPGGGALNIEVNQHFGCQQARTVSGFQNASFNSVAAFFGIATGTSAVAGGTRGFPQWGSVTDKYNTAGTTALHCRVFDAWPHEDTIWDTRFFSALHFNPTIEDEDGLTSVDFRVPTLSGGGFPSDGTAVTSSNVGEYLDRNDWTYDTIRRGKLLTNGGFKYNKLTIGLDPSSVVIAKAGETAVGGNAESISSKFKFTVQVSEAGAVTGILANHYDALGERMDGEDLEADAFSGVYVDEGGTTHTGYILRYADAVLIFQGKVRLVKKQDTGPIQHGGVVRCTSSSNNGDETVTGVQSSEIGLNPNDTGQYDAYFFFHNDISHTYQDSRWDPFMSPGLQYIIANIS